MSDIKINNITDRSGSSGPIFAGISTVSTSAFMVMPSGPTEFRGGRGRAVFSRGSNPGTYLNTMDYVVIASTGNASDFGDMTYTNNRDGASGSSKTRGIVGAGGDPYTSPYPKTGTINSVEIATTGDALDFGDLTSTRNHMAGCSNGHGGL